MWTDVVGHRLASRWTSSDCLRQQLSPITMMLASACLSSRAEESKEVVQRLDFKKFTGTEQAADFGCRTKIFCSSEFEVGALLGKGGFGSVYKCVARGQLFALKKLYANSQNPRAFTESVAAETLSLGLVHPNIVRTLAVFVMDAVHCVLMEYVGSSTLQAILDSRIDNIDEKLAYKFALDVAQGLQYAHSLNIAHLDLKPANILVTPSGSCKIGDFGCCLAIGEQENPSTPTRSSLTGTYSYRAPELLKGEPASLKADIYSFGICLWQMLTRERPYGREHHQVIIFKVVAYNCRPQMPEQTTWNTAYLSLMQRCWDKEKDVRPWTLEIIDILSTLL